MRTHTGFSKVPVNDGACELGGFAGEGSPCRRPSFREPSSPGHSCHDHSATRGRPSRSDQRLLTRRGERCGSPTGSYAEQGSTSSSADAEEREGGEGGGWAGGGRGRSLGPRGRCGTERGDAGPSAAHDSPHGYDPFAGCTSRRGDRRQDGSRDTVPSRSGEREGSRGERRRVAAPESGVRPVSAAAARAERRLQEQRSKADAAERAAAKAAAAAKVAETAAAAAVAEEAVARAVAEEEAAARAAAEEVARARVSGRTRGAKGARPLVRGTPSKGGKLGRAQIRGRESARPACPRGGRGGRCSSEESESESEGQDSDQSGCAAGGGGYAASMISSFSQLMRPEERKRSREQERRAAARRGEGEGSERRRGVGYECGGGVRTRDSKREATASKGRVGGGRGGEHAIQIQAPPGQHGQLD